MSLQRIQSIFAFNQHLLIAEFYKRGFELTFGEAMRPRSQVLLNFYGYDVRESGGVLSLVKVGRTSNTLVSRHPDRLAVDYNIFYQGRLLFSDATRYTEDLELVRPIGDYWESLNTANRWGADWNKNNIDDERLKDPYHFECKP